MWWNKRRHSEQPTLRKLISGIYATMLRTHAETLIFQIASLEKDRQIMSALDDLKAAMARIASDIKTVLADLAAAQTNNDDAGVESAVSQLNALSDSLEAATKPGDGTGNGPLPVITGLSPASGPSTGAQVTVTGSGFTGTTGVTVGGLDDPNFSVIDDTSITCTIPPGTGTADVVVTTPAGSSGPMTFSYSG